MSHAKVTAYADFTQRLIKNFYKKKSEEKKLPPPLTARALASGGRTLAPLQSGLDLLTFKVPCTILEMHEEEETYTNADATIEEQPSSSIVGEVITPEEGTLCRNTRCSQEKPRYAHISISYHFITSYGGLREYSFA